MIDAVTYRYSFSSLCRIGVIKIWFHLMNEGSPSSGEYDNQRLSIV